MTNKEIILEEEIKKMFLWANESSDAWKKIVGKCSSKELSDIIETLEKEELYFPIAFILINSFIEYDGSKLMKRILAEVFISQWNKDTWEIVTSAVKNVCVLAKLSFL